MVINKIIINLLASEFHRNPSNEWNIKPNVPCICKKGTIKLHESTSKSRLRDESSEFHGSWSGGLV